MNKQEVFEEIEKANETGILRLENCIITNEIWDKILKLSDLNLLDFHVCELGEIPDTIHTLTNLTGLRLNSCELRILPIIVTKISQLEDLCIDSNQLTELPVELENLKNLHGLDISYNQFNKIPEVLTQLPKLSYLNLRGNQIEEIPKEINKLQNLQNLNLDGNKIKTIPKEITQLQNLESLNFGQNKIKIIPKEIEKLKKLEYFAFYSNQIKTIPEEIKNLNALQEFHFEMNPIKSLKFAYVISDDLNYTFENRFNLEAYKVKKISNFFDSMQMNYSDAIIFLKSKTNYAFIKPIRNPSNLKKYVNGFKHGTLKQNMGDGSACIIHIFGEKETQKQFLSEIRNGFEQWIESLNLEIKSRLFFYPVNDKKEIIIDYDLLLKNQEYDYYDAELNQGFPVNKLLNYIDVAENAEAKQEWKVRGHLTQVQIKNLKLFEDISFNLSPNINIVLGHNGLGKTSVLQGITLGLLPVENTDKPDDFSHFIHFGNENAEILLAYAENEKREVHIIPSGLVDLNRIGTSSHILLAYGVNLNADGKILPQFLTELIEGNSKLYATKSIFKPYSNDFNDPLAVLYELERASKLNPECRKLIDLIVNKINAYLDLVFEDEKMQLIEENGFYYFKDFKQNNLELHHLSEGYKDHILLITDIFLRIIASRRSWASENTEFVSPTIFEEAKGVILIDEFDRHLHPVWQRRLLFELKKDFPNIQFILTTHNIFSLQSAVGANAIQLVVKEGKIEVETKTIARKNILGIIREFYTKDFFDYETQQELSLFSEHLDRIHGGDVDFVYSEEFKNVVRNLDKMGTGIQRAITNQLLQLNSTLKKLGKKEFEL